MVPGYFSYSRADLWSSTWIPALPGFPRSPRYDTIGRFRSVSRCRHKHILPEIRWRRFMGRAGRAPAHSAQVTIVWQHRRIHIFYISGIFLERDPRVTLAGAKSSGTSSSCKRRSRSNLSQFLAFAQFHSMECRNEIGRGANLRLRGSPTEQKNLAAIPKLLFLAQ